MQLLGNTQPNPSERSSVAVGIKLVARISVDLLGCSVESAEGHSLPSA